MFSKAAQQAESKLGRNPSAFQSGHGFGTAPVFLASVSTILGAILFLRFGYAVAHVGLGLTLVIIALGHFVTIPTVLAVSEIATNRRVAGGGAYFIVSRSFGMSIGGTIGIALYLSQAISVAFYMVAFAEAFEPLKALAIEKIQWIQKPPDSRWVSLPCTGFLIALMLTRGANLGVRALWGVCCILAAAITAFLLGGSPETAKVIGEASQSMQNLGTDADTQSSQGLRLGARIKEHDGFGVVFATCFPAFTGMIAGLGLSGDLKNPQRSIPLGTIGATFAGMVIYTVVAIKLALSASPDELAADYFIMAKISIWSPVIYIGLAAAAFSSALGSIMVAPRTLQALARDNVLPIPKLNRLLEKGLGKAQEPFYATCVSGAIAIVFVMLGGVNTIARILTMFFMVTYGALCAVSFLEYFSGNPSYRPTFHTRWYLSLLGAVMCGLMMIRIDILYTFLALLLMVATYIGLRRSRHGQRDLTAIFQGTMFQLTRRLQIFLQKSRAISSEDGWRPSIVAVTRFGERRLGHFDLLRWICHRHGFGQFIQFSEGDYSFSSEVAARLRVDELIQRTAVSRAGIFVDSLICPTFQLALAQTLQMPGVSGLPNNSILLEFDQDTPEEIKEVEQGARLAANSMFNVLILRSTKYRFGYRASIHVWVTEETLSNAPMMLMFAYIIVGHPEWKRAEIKLFGCFDSTEAGREVNKLSTIMTEGRLPISIHNVTSVSCSMDELEEEVFHRSAQADLVIAGLKADSPEPRAVADALRHYERANEVLLVHSSEQISIR